MAGLLGHYRREEPLGIVYVTEPDVRIPTYAELERKIRKLEQKIKKLKRKK